MHFHLAALGDPIRIAGSSCPGSRSGAWARVAPQGDREALGLDAAFAQQPVGHGVFHLDQPEQECGWVDERWLAALDRLVGALEGLFV
jgi:hypothetical protein